MALGEVKVEENKVLKELTQAILGRVDEIHLDLVCVGELDATFAQGQMALALDAQAPQVKADPELDSLHLEDARHPHLVLQQHENGETVIANSISFAGAQGLVVSGPNAGGKTVVLKMVGLMTAMVRAGLPIPASPKSVVPLFDGVIAMVGDGQSIENAMSTFSAEAHALKQVIESVVRVKGQKKMLVLLDELFAGTDAQEGGALARASLEYLLESGASLMVTTHLEAVKNGLETTESAASFKSMFMAYDPHANKPTFNLHADGTGQGKHKRQKTLVCRKIFWKKH